MLVVALTSSNTRKYSLWIASNPMGLWNVMEICSSNPCFWYDILIVEILRKCRRFLLSLISRVTSQRKLAWVYTHACNAFSSPRILGQVTYDTSRHIHVTVHTFSFNHYENVTGSYHNVQSTLLFISLMATQALFSKGGKAHSMFVILLPCTQSV